jgi:hypothetical protein
MTNQKAAARKISSFVTPTEDDLAYFDSLSAGEQRALLKAELDKESAGSISSRSFDEIIAEMRASLATRRSNG